MESAFIHKQKSAWASWIALVIMICLYGCSNQEIIKSLEKKSEEAAILNQQLSETREQISQQEIVISQKDHEIGRLKKELYESEERIKKSEEQMRAEQKAFENERQALNKKVKEMGNDVTRLTKANRTISGENLTLKDENASVLEGAKTGIAIVAVAAEAALTACDAENARLKALLKSASTTIERMKNGR